MKKYVVLMLLFASGLCVASDQEILLHSLQLEEAELLKEKAEEKIFSAEQKNKPICIKFDNLEIIEAQLAFTRGKIAVVLQQLSEK